MKIIFYKDKTQNQNRAIVIIGIGLVGSAIYSNLKKRITDTCIDCKIDWSNAEVASLILTKNLTTNLTTKIDRIDWIWSAGKAGFSALEQEVKNEYNIFLSCIESIKNFQNNFYPKSTHIFHLISSAGGLFDGQLVTSIKDLPYPKSLYGKLKLDQEGIIKDLFHYNIYRLSTIFDYYKKNCRIGLIAALIKNTVCGKITTIVNPQTQRDYVWADDMADFILQKVLENYDTFDSSVFFIVSGKPTTIFEIISSIQKITKNKVLQNYNWDDKNSETILFSPCIKPKNLRSTSMDVCIRNIYKKVLHVS